MKKSIMVIAIFALALTAAVASDSAENKKATAAERIAALEARCAESAAARSKVGQGTTFYHRLGGYEKIQALTEEIVRLHLENDELKGAFYNINMERLKKNVSDFIAVGTGGPQTYNGMSLEESHKHRNITEAEFVAATEDIIQAMKNLGYAVAEIDEMVCIVVSMKGQVLPDPQ